MKKMGVLGILVIFTVFIAIASSVLADSSTSTKNFVKNAAIGNRFEVLSSQLAIEKSDNEEVKRFAQKMIDDHSKASGELRVAVEAVNKEDIKFTEKLDSKHQQILNNLKKASASDFDREYIKAQVDAHNETVILFDEYSKNGYKSEIRDFAERTLPTLQEHKNHAEQLAYSNNSK